MLCLGMGAQGVSEILLLVDDRDRALTGVSLWRT